MMLETLGINAKKAERELLKLNTTTKNDCLKAVAEALTCSSQTILEANALDVAIAREKGMKESLVDRLALTDSRIASMAEGLTSLIALEDPIGEILEAKIRPNGLEIGKKRVPLGVIGIIYESRPNVTADAFGLCFKTSNAVILKGGSDAIHSNKAIVDIIRRALEEKGVTPDAIQLVEDTNRETAKQLMRMNQYLTSYASPVRLFGEHRVFRCMEGINQKQRSHSERKCRTHPHSCRKQYRPCYRDRYRKLPCLCGCLRRY